MIFVKQPCIKSIKCLFISGRFFRVRHSDSKRLSAKPRLFGRRVLGVWKGSGAIQLFVSS